VVLTSLDLIHAEDAGWARLHALVDTLSPEEGDRPGYYPEGWSVTDLLGHVGSWLAAGGSVLERIHAGTYRDEEVDVDEWNERFLIAMKGVSFEDARTQSLISRARMLQAWTELGDLTPEAAFWIDKAGAAHYAEHLPRLGEWVAELHGGPGA